MTEAKTVNVPQVAKKTATDAVAKAKTTTFSAVVKSDAFQKSIAQTLGDVAKTKTFTANLISAVSTNPELQKCEPISVVSAALIGESLNLSPSPQLGNFYMVPFNDNKTGTKKANFILGWKGYYQLALRSGQYKNIDAVAIKEGELKSYNPITGEITLEPIEDVLERERAKTIGYYAFFTMVNGFEKRLYWTREKMEAHALKYSKGYAAKKGYTFWEKDFDGMALKTMYRQLISKYGIMSIEMQKAFTADDHVQTINEETGEVETIEFGDSDIIEAEFVDNGEH